MANAAAQLDLDLTPPPGWGGCRTGAGRKPAVLRHVPHRMRAPVARHTPCHVTLRVRRGAPSLRDGRLVREVERTWRAARERGSFRLVHYSLQHDHVHLVVEAESPDALARGMMSLGARLARAVNRIFGRRGAVLAERFHVRILRTPREVRNALAYVLLNFRKHAIGIGRAYGAIDPASSARWFDGWRRGPPPARDEPAVSPARSWLLRVGWWRHGRIDPSEVPGR
jgi:REP element-mobilizing transposase RayT